MQTEFTDNLDELDKLIQQLSLFNKTMTQENTLVTLCPLSIAGTKEQRKNS